VQAPFFIKEALMTIPGLDAEFAAQQLGAGGVDNIVTNAERISTYEARRIELANEAVLVNLKAQYELLVQEEHGLEERLRLAPPAGDLRRLRLKAIYHWSLTVLLTVAGFAFALLTFAPFRLGWKARLYCGGIAALAPFLVEHLLDGVRMERIVKVLTAAATVAAFASLMLLAVIRGNLLAQDIQANAAPAVVLDDVAPQAPPTQNTFYDATLTLLRVALLLLAFAMELGAGLALSEAWRSAPDASKDWNKLRAELAGVRIGLAQIARQATMLRNEPDLFVARFWRDFYRGLLTNAARSAMTKLLLYVLIGFFVIPALGRAQTSHRLNLVVAIDLTQSVAVSGPDGGNEFRKNIDGVARVLTQVPAGAHVTISGITDRSFAQPYILLSARVPDDPGYFDERLDAARRQLVSAWKSRSGQLDSRFPHTDILGALALASQIFAAGSAEERKELVVFSDMREDMPGLDFESQQIVPPFASLGKQCGAMPDLRGVEVYLLGVDGAGKSLAYWQSLQAFWREYLRQSGADLLSYSILRELTQGGDL
jgi:hypothetical protein